MADLETLKNQYFAAKEPTACADTLLKKATSFYNTMSANFYLYKVESNWRFYYGAQSGDITSGHRISFTGEQGELTHLPVNHFRSIARAMHTLITSNRPTMETKAVNTDSKSLSQTYLANGILDYYMRERGLENAINRATEMAVVLGSGYVKMEWDATGGEIYDIDEDTKEHIFSGDINFDVLSPLDVVVDGTKESFENDWMLCRSFKNRFDLMAKYPELANKINGITGKGTSTVYKLAVFSNDDTDDIPVYEFFHKATPALPEGRYMLFLDSDVVLIDTKMPYRTIPVYRVCESEILGTPYAYTVMFDLYPLQEMVNASYSAIATNQNAFAVQNVYIPRGADISMESINGGMNIIEGNAKPEAVNLTQTPAEVFKFMDVLIQAMESISGINSVARGNPPSNLQSGTALALVQSMALQYLSNLQRNYVKLIENCGQGIITMLKDFAMTPRVIALVGKANRTYLKEFKGEDIASINRVTVDVGNALAKTTAGKIEIANQMMQMKLIKTHEQYFMVLNTGRLDSMYEGDMMSLMNIKRENEKMMDGTMVRAIITDNHRAHINEHKTLLDDPDMRDDANLVSLVLNHIQEHIDLLRNADPETLIIMGQQPITPEAPVDQQGQPQPANKATLKANQQLMPMEPLDGGSMMQSDGSELPMPGMPKVPAELLANPELQEQSLGNLR